MTAIFKHSYKYKSKLKSDVSELIETVLLISVTVYEDITTTKVLFNVTNQFNI